ncbi:MAG: hypothetical protein ACQKBY_01720 [Verrucomicrobiales bacterium]
MTKYSRQTLVFSLFALVSALPAAEVTVTSLAELAEYASQDGNTVTLAPGTYQLDEFLTEKVCKERREKEEFTLLNFSGSNNTFIFKDSEIIHNTQIRSWLRPPTHSNEFVISGNNNSFSDLSIRCTGQFTSRGGALVQFSGRNNRLARGRFFVQGSSPYGYGDLFGKGGQNVIPHAKHSGVLITGDGTQLTHCQLVMRSFGHGYFLQQDCADVVLSNCRVEGEMRESDDILKETDTRAAEVGFRTMIRTRGGEHKVLPGYIKSLCEDGFRTYGTHKNLVIRDCIAVNMRGGYEIRNQAGGLLENCQALGCERGFWVTSGARVKNALSDHLNGPALFVEGEGAEVELRVKGGRSPHTLHSLATICGTRHKIHLRPAELIGNGSLTTPIMLGHTPPPAGENMAPYNTRKTEQVNLRNETEAPVEVSETAADCEITSQARVKVDPKAQRIRVNK